MPKISVIIPVFNHADELVECLKSLHQQTEKDFELIIVDDGSSEPVKNADIRFEKNLGAPAARNAGFAKSKGEYVIFLDADAELIPSALSKMLAALESHPEADFVYPSFKWGWKLFKSRPFDADALKQGNYIHTSALIRRKAFPGFDESLKKFQDWDLFLTMSEQGKRGYWIDEVLFSLKPRKTGMSQWLPAFVYDLPWNEIGWTPKLVRKYQDAESIVRKKHDLVVGTQNKIEVAGPAALLISLELLSTAAAWNPTLNSTIAVILGVAMLVLAYKKPTVAFSYLVLEFLVGSKGRLFVLGANAANDGGISIRIILFAAFMIGWFAARRGHFKRTIPPAFSALFVLIAYGMVRGLFQHQPFVYADANAWGALLLIFPIQDLIAQDSKKFWATLKPIIMIGIFWLILKSIALFYFFSHAFSSSFLEPLNRWIRRTGVGEITLLGDGGVARIFIQSQIYALLGAVYLSMRAAQHRVRKEHWSALALCLLAILISFSRSFWIGLAAGFFICFLEVLRRKTWTSWFKGMLVAGALAFIALIGIALFPLPRSTAGSPISWFTARVDAGESAATSRWELLPILFDKAMQSPILGHGFGATVTYQSADPRIVQATGGQYTTYAFEWGWMDFWIKFGILGPFVVLWLLGSIIKKRPELAPIIITLAIVHFFTPYLNHPLGLLVLILAA